MHNGCEMKSRAYGHLTNDSLEELIHVGRRALRLLEDGNDRFSVFTVLRRLNSSTVEVSNLLSAGQGVSAALDAGKKNPKPGDRSKYQGRERRR